MLRGMRSLLRDYQRMQAPTMARPSITKIDEPLTIAVTSRGAICRSRRAGWCRV
jgi:hypothetical protein